MLLNRHITFSSLSKLVMKKNYDNKQLTPNITKWFKTIPYFHQSSDQAYNPLFGFMLLQ